ncbi:MAG: UDP-N-acetylmuramate dehydrogenase [Motiliproteus sp.]|jgi:UDP-N-acetylmuramate dehydrogenase
MRSQVDLSSFNTLRLPAVASQFIQADTRQQLLAGIAQHAHPGQPLLLLGGGSNLIFTRDVEGLCLRINSRGIHAESLSNACVRVTAEAGEPWHQFVSHCLDHGWYGLENLALIPGTVGAAPIQNIGAYGVEVKHLIHQVEVWDTEQAQLRFLSNAQCRFGYRDSLFKGGEQRGEQRGKQRGKQGAGQGRFVIVSVIFDLPTHFSPQLAYGGLAAAVVEAGVKGAPSARQVFDAVVRIRQHKLPDPKLLANAGSFFKNPVITCSEFKQLQTRSPAIVGYPDAGGVKLAAGWLIDQAGWKGWRQGAVGVHAHQALVLVNYGGATGEELLLLAGAIQADIQARFGVALEIEPRII